MECKVVDIFYICNKCVDLIETLWNVKLQRKQVVGSSLVDLIETLWNVKVSIDAAAPSDAAI